MNPDHATARRDAPLPAREPSARNGAQASMTGAHPEGGPQNGDFLRRLASRDLTLAVIGLGYVGVPLALVALRAGFRVLGHDVDPARVATLNAGATGLAHLPGEALADAATAGRFEATLDAGRLSEADAILIAVPTPLTRHREPDLAHVEAASRAIGAALKPGQLVVLESTTWPGTTEEVVKPLLEAASGLTSGRDFFLAFSPEREDPGNAEFGTRNIPKVVGADEAEALARATALYDALVERTVPVSSARTAEAVKLTENIFRSVNIALVNELKLVFGEMGIDIWEVIEAAKTKPFGFMPFYPGPGLGGHCVSIDPFYLTWKAREYDVATRFIELAGEINVRMPYHVLAKLAEALDRHAGTPLSGANVLVVGVAYKRNVADVRESPALKLMELIERRGGRASFHDPHVAAIPHTPEHPDLAGRESVPLDAKTLAASDAVLIATDHDAVDYAHLAAHARLVVDTRNACARHGVAAAHVVKA